MLMISKTFDRNTLIKLTDPLDSVSVNQFSMINTLGDGALPNSLKLDTNKSAFLSQLTQVPWEKNGPTKMVTPSDS